MSVSGVFRGFHVFRGFRVSGRGDGRPSTRRRSGLLAAVLAAVSTVAGCSDAPSGPASAPYASEALEAAKTMVGLQVAAIRSQGRHLSYRETRDQAAALGLTVIAGGSRDASTVSVQVEFVTPAGVVPVAVEDGRDCVMAIITYPVDQAERFPSAPVEVEGPLFPLDGTRDGIEVSWILFHDYFLQPAVLPSAVCAAEAFAGIDRTSFDPSFDPALPVVFDPPS